MIVVDGVSVRYGEVRALEKVSLCVAEGGKVAVCGPSGSGKTTLLRAIAGLQPIDEGRILLDGRVVSVKGQGVSPSQRQIGYVFQAPALWPHMTVAQNISFGLARIPRDEAHRRLEYLAEQTGIGGLLRRYPHQLSGGEARRVALARTLAPRPRFILMDEPLTNLDDALRAELITLIRAQLAETGAALVYVTHDADEAAQLADRIVRIARTS